MCHLSIKLRHEGAPKNENLESGTADFNFGYNVFLCKLCDIEFGTEEIRDRHVKLSHEGTKIIKVNLQEIIIYRCKPCSIEFSKKHHFDDHMKTFHKGEKFIRTEEVEVTPSKNQLDTENILKSEVDENDPLALEKSDESTENEPKNISQEFLNGMQNKVVIHKYMYQKKNRKKTR